jgi:ubiquinone/menaquinone biosynthesis C-methylase UbiE
MPIILDDILTVDLQDYPKLDNVPWLIPEPEQSLTEWKIKAKAYFKHENNYCAFLQQKCHSAEKEKAKRLTQYIQARKDHLKQVEKILKPLFAKEDNIADENIFADTQSVFSYQDLILRDWCWEQEELKTYSDYIRPKLSENQKVLILGSGAGGLATRLASDSPCEFVAIDINPYLMLAANKLTNGKNIKLYEFPFGPIKKDNEFHKWDIKPTKDNLENLHYLFADFRNLPFKEKTFDVVISCWFYDVIEMDLNNSLAITNKFLKDDGENIFMGPAVFNHKDISKRMSHEDIVSTFNNHYDCCNKELKEITYLNSPFEMQHRLETLLFLHAQKPNRLQTEFSKEEKKDITMTPELQAYIQKQQVFGRILKHINGDMYFSTLAKRLEGEFGFTPEEADYYAKNFMKNLLKEINY